MTATAAPSAASALATAAPIPLDAPVTIATLPANFFISMSLFVRNWISITRALTRAFCPPLKRFQLGQQRMESFLGIGPVRVSINPVSVDRKTRQGGRSLSSGMPRSPSLLEIHRQTLPSHPERTE